MTNEELGGYLRARTKRIAVLTAEQERLRVERSVLTDRLLALESELREAHGEIAEVLKELEQGVSV